MWTVVSCIACIMCYLIYVLTENICQQITLRDSKPVFLVRCSCSCVAGTAMCNHTVALLYQTAHYSQLSVPVVPPVHSCTEEEQQWHKPRTAVSFIIPQVTEMIKVICFTMKTGNT